MIPVVCDMQYNGGGYTVIFLIHICYELAKAERGAKGCTGVMRANYVDGVIYDVTLRY